MKVLFATVIVFLLWSCDSQNDSNGNSNSIISDELVPEKTEFITDAFRNAGFEVEKINKSNLKHLTLIRNHSYDSSFFIMAIAGSDFRDPHWMIDLRVGKGYPESANDEVEFFISSISLTELGVMDEMVTSYISKSIREVELEGIFSKPVEFCIDFLSGNTGSPILARNRRNSDQLIDPLGLDSEASKALYAGDEAGYMKMKASLKDRNAELRILYKKYLE